MPHHYLSSIFFGTVRHNSYGLRRLKYDIQVKQKTVINDFGLREARTQLKLEEQAVAARDDGVP